jgi:radical SAM superfamily enzyme YgiQ (UPF0313 family)
MAGKPRVLLVFSTPIKPNSFFGFLLPPLGLERIAAELEDIAEVLLLDLRFDADRYLELAEQFQPDWIGINVKTTLYASHSYRTADRLRARFPRATFVFGGLHASSLPEEPLKNGDITVIGDGEEAFRELVSGRTLEEVAGIVYKNHEGRFVKTAPRTLLADIDRLKPPARHLRRPGYKYAAAGLITMDLLETSRGCSQFCPFCSPAVFHKGTWRAHSPEYVLEEVKRLDRLGAKYVMLTDDHFSGDLDRAKRISELIIDSGIKIGFFCFLRPFLGRMDVKTAMVKAGFVMLSYGAESPNPEQLKKFGKGFHDPVEFVKTVNREWHEAGARYIGNSFVFGDPGETAADLQRLGDYARELDPTYIEPLYSQPYPGTRYRETLLNKGQLRPHGWDQFTESRLIVKHPHLDEHQIRDLRVRMWLRFFSPRKISGAFRVPLYFRNVLGLPLRTVLKYMKACDYSVFGSILEDKFYFHRRREMVREYLREHINTFPPEERDMTPFSDEFTTMLGLAPLKKWLGDTTLGIEITDGGRTLTRFHLIFAQGRLQKVWAGLEPTPIDRRLALRLEDVVSFFCGREFEKAGALVRTLLLNLLGRTTLIQINRP